MSNMEKNECTGCAIAFLCRKDGEEDSGCPPTERNRAVVFCAVLPLVVLLGGTVSVRYLTGSERAACLAGLAAVAFYFLSFRLFRVVRERISRKNNR